MLNINEINTIIANELTTNFDTNALYADERNGQIVLCDHNDCVPIEDDATEESIRADVQAWMQAVSQ